MKKIFIECLENARSLVEITDVLMEGDNLAVKIEVKYPENSFEFKWIDVEFANGQKQRFFLGDEDLGSVVLKRDETIAGRILIEPFATDTISGDATDFKYKPVEAILRKGVDASLNVIVPSEDVILDAIEQFLGEVYGGLVDSISYNPETSILTIYLKNGSSLSTTFEETIDEILATLQDEIDKVLQEAKDYADSLVPDLSEIEQDIVNLENANMFKDVVYNNVNGVLTFTRYDDTTKEIDLPLELLVESGYYDEAANELVLVLANGSDIRIPVGNLLTDLDAHNIRFNGSGTNYLTTKTDVEGAVKELDTRVKTNADNVALKVNTSDIVDNLNSTDTDKPLSANQGKTLQDTKENLSNKVVDFSVVNDTRYPSVKAVKDQLDTTAKLAVSNAFTQPQQVPNATQPQHATNLSQVETMFEMFKRQLRGYNLAMPDLSNATYLGDGWYRRYYNAGITMDYNIYSGIFSFNGTTTRDITIRLIQYEFELEYYIASYYYINGTTTGATQSLFFADYNTQNQILLIANTQNIIDVEYSQPKTPIVSPSYVYMYIHNNRQLNNYQFKLQIEQGTTATPYTVPGQIPQYKIVGEE